MAAGGARPAESVPALRHHRIDLIGEADAAAVRLLSCLALVLQVCQSLQEAADFQIATLRARLQFLQGRAVTWLGK